MVELKQIIKEILDRINSKINKAPKKSKFNKFGNNSFRNKNVTVPHCPYSIRIMMYLLWKCWYVPQKCCPRLSSNALFIVGYLHPETWTNSKPPKSPVPKGCWEDISNFHKDIVSSLLPDFINFHSSVALRVFILSYFPKFIPPLS